MKKFLNTTGFLVNGIGIIGGVILIGGASILKAVFGGKAPSLYINLLIIISGLFFSASCIFTIKRKEVPRIGLSSIKGRVAVLFGWLGLLFFGGCTIFILISLILGQF